MEHGRRNGRESCFQDGEALSELPNLEFLESSVLVCVCDSLVQIHWTVPIC